MGNLGLQSGIPWLRIKSEDKCILCSIEKEDIIHFSFCPYFFNDCKSFWYRLRQIVLASSDGDAQTFLLFVKNLDNDSRIRLLTGCLTIPRGGYFGLRSYGDVPTFRVDFLTQNTLDKVQIWVSSKCWAKKIF